MPGAAQSIRSRWGRAGAADTHEATVSFAGNLTDQPEVRDTQGERRSSVESKVSVSDWGSYAHADA